MDTLPKEILEKVILDMEARNILGLCKLNRAIRDKICNNQTLWRKLVERDVHHFVKDYVYILRDKGKSWKDIYKIIHDIDDTVIRKVDTVLAMAKTRIYITPYRSYIKNINYFSQEIQKFAATTFSRYGVNDVIFTLRISPAFDRKWLVVTTFYSGHGDDHEKRDLYDVETLKEVLHKYFFVVDKDKYIKIYT